VNSEVVKEGTTEKVMTKLGLEGYLSVFQVERLMEDS
jgi:hypothetical protein